MKTQTIDGNQCHKPLGKGRTISSFFIHIKYNFIKRNIQNIINFVKNIYHILVGQKVIKAGGVTNYTSGTYVEFRPPYIRCLSQQTREKNKILLSVIALKNALQCLVLLWTLMAS